MCSLKKRILPFLLSSSLLANEVHYLEDITVTTGTRTAKVLAEMPIKTEVITQKDIARVHARDASEAITSIPGLLIKRTHGKDGQSVWIQGFNANRILILINGEQLTASTGSTVDLSQIAVNDVERIEVIKGASSALYGSQAMGGVINIITKEAKEGFHSKLTLEGGTFDDKGVDTLGLGLMRASTSYKTKDIVTSLDVDYRHESGVKLQEGYSYDLPEINRVNVNAEIRFLGDMEWYVKPRFYMEKSKKPFTSFTPGIGDVFEEKTEDAYKYRVSAGGKKEFDNDDKLQFSTFFERYDDDSNVDKLATDYVDQARNAQIDLAQAQIQYDIMVKDEHLLTMGIDLHYEALTQTNTKTNIHGSTVVNELESDAKRHGVEVYLQDDWCISEDLELVPGIRYQYDSDFGSYVSPKFSLMYTPYKTDTKRLNIRSSYGNGYRAPNLKERFFFFDHSALGYQVLGKADLQPETSHSYQLSTEWVDKANNYSLALNLYYNNITGLIEAIKDQELSAQRGLQIFQYQNVEKALTKGVELEFNVSFMKHFSLSGGYTYLYSRNKKTKKTLTGRPEHQVKINFNVDYQGYEGVIAFTHESEQFVDSKNLLVSPKETQVDVKLTKHVTKLLSVYGGVENLFDEHKDPNNHVNDERTKRPRFIYAGVSYKF